jgi:hypothetical protein
MAVAAAPTITVAATSRRVPWHVWCLVAAVTSNVIGVHWDIAWHRSIGRDEFLTPAHLLIYLCGVLAGISCGYLILATTFRRDHPLWPASVRVLGFRAPLGAFLAAWGGIAMLVSAPFDDWWHNAYGLDVKVLSPPHMVLALGMIGVCAGALILILGYRNRSGGALLEALLLYVLGMLLCSLMLVAVEYTYRTLMHSAIFYRTVGLVAPAVPAAAIAVSSSRWAATAVTGVYTAVWLGALWILPLAPAEPKLGPVYFPVTHLVPLGFPLLVIAGALAVDLVRPKLACCGPWLKAALLGTLFLGVFVAVQWPFADFLMSPAARNAFFGSHYFDYNARPESYQVRYLFYPYENSAGAFRATMAAAAGLAVVTFRIGLGFGAWMRRIQR